MSTAPGSRFLLLGEPLALDLVNTRARRLGAPVDLLNTPAALSAWLACERGRVAWTGAVTPADLAAVRDLRAAITLLMDALGSRKRAPARTVAALNAALSSGSTGAPQLAWTTTRPRLATVARTPRQALLHALAADALALLTGPDAGRVRQCAHPDCILRFVARNPRRRWCAAATCGNRARVARHYLRHHETS